MADTPKADDAQDAMKKQIAELRREITKINKTLADRAEEVAEQASTWYDGAAERASRATQQLRTQAHVASEMAQQNPMTASTVVGIAGLVGFLIGMAIGQASHTEDRHRWF